MHANFTDDNLVSRRPHTSIFFPPHEANNLMLLERDIKPSHVPAIDNYRWGRVGDTLPLPENLLEFPWTELLVSIPDTGRWGALLPVMSTEIAGAFPLAETYCWGGWLLLAGKDFDEFCLLPLLFLLFQTVCHSSEQTVLGWEHCCSS
jgi:hypothetical protein